MEHNQKDGVVQDTTLSEPLTTNIINDFYKDGIEITDKEIGKLTNDMFILPPDSEASINDFINNLPEASVLKATDNETKRTINSLMDARKLPNLHDMGGMKELHHLDNSLNVNGTELRLKNVNVKGNSKNFGSMKVKLSEKLNIGVPVHVPLYHSGFWVTLAPLSTKIEKINLQLELTKEINRVGKKTHNLIFSNHSVLFAETLVDTLRNKITDTSLALPENEDIFDYIKIQDLDILIWGLLKSMYPRGFDYIVLCKNAVTPDDNSTPKCNFKLNVKLDLYNMLKVDNDLFSIEHKQLMLKRSSKSVSVDDITEYQNTLSVNEEDTINITLDDYLINLNIESPSINKYLENGRYFVENISDKVNDLIKNDVFKEDDEASRSNAENMMINSIIVSIYNHYIKSVSLNGVVKEEYDDIYDILELLSSEDDVKNMVVNKILNYINKSLAAVIGIPNYVCPVCKASQADSKHNFNSFVGLDVYTYFFTLLAFQYQKATTGLLLK